MRIKTKEGDIFAVPLLDGGYGLGLIARKNKIILLGYFFNKVYTELPQQVTSADIDRKNIIVIAKFGSQGIDNKEWPIIQHAIPFCKDEWPIPKFQMQDILFPDKYWGIIFDETLLSDKRQLISQEEASKLFESSSRGYLLMQRELTKLLRQQPPA